MINTLMQAGVPTTTFRPVIFMDNLLTDWARRDILENNIVRIQSYIDQVKELTSRIEERKNLINIISNTTTKEYNRDVAIKTELVKKRLESVKTELNKLKIL